MMNTATTKATKSLAGNEAHTPSRSQSEEKSSNMGSKNSN